MSNADLIARLLRHDVRHCECEFCAAPRDAAAVIAAQDKTIAALREALIEIRAFVPVRSCYADAQERARAALVRAEGTEQA